MKVITGPSLAFLDERFVNVPGDTMVGPLIITPTADGTSILRINKANGTAVFIVDTINERVGIGTATLIDALNIHGSAFAVIRFTNDDTGETAADGFQFGIDGSERGVFIQRENDDILFQIGGAAGSNVVLMLDNTGNVRIGQGTGNSPAKLHILGDADDEQFVVQAHATQTANLVEQRQSDGITVDTSFLGGGANFNQQGNDVDHIIGGNTEPNLVRIDAGLDATHLGDWDMNYVSIDKAGDVVFVGGAGLPFGGIWAHAVTDIIDSVAQNDWDQIVAFNTDSESNNCTPAHGTADITITKAGKYQVSFNWSGHGTNVAHDWDWHVCINNNDTCLDNITAHGTNPTTQKVFSVSCIEFADLEVGDTVELWVQRTSVGNNIDLTTVHCTLSILQVGGT